jgi:hypothetical protein
MAVEPREIVAGNVKSGFGWLAVVLVICVLHIATTDGSHTGSWALLVGVVLLGLLLAFLRSRPPARFVLDKEGFGLAGHPRLARWEEVESFGVMEVPRVRFMDQWKVVTIKYRPGIDMRMLGSTKLNEVLGNGTGTIIFVWPRPHEVIAEELNAYRLAALEGGNERIDRRS